MSGLYTVADVVTVIAFAILIVAGVDLALEFAEKGDRPGAVRSWVFTSLFLGLFVIQMASLWGAK